MTKKIAVIDGNSFMHRAYHSVPPTMTAQDGTHTNAIFGFFSMLFSFVKKKTLLFIDMSKNGSDILIRNRIET